MGIENGAKQDQGMRDSTPQADASNSVFQGNIEGSKPKIMLTRIPKASNSAQKENKSSCPLTKEGGLENRRKLTLGLGNLPKICLPQKRSLQESDTNCWKGSRDKRVKLMDGLEEEDKSILDLYR